MKRAPIVIAGTVAGLLGVLEFHTNPARLTASGPPTTPTAVAPASAGKPTGTSGRSAGLAGTGDRSSSGSTSGGSQMAVGPGVNYYYGVVAVKVTVSHGEIVKVGIASLNDGANPRSQFVDQQSIPILEQEVIRAQSANIQGVSGASYTSAGFDQSLQSALHRLGFT
jgi:uncharacterized protein with FMN-binding domain